jgi:hypothetical protein
VETKLKARDEHDQGDYLCVDIRVSDSDAGSIGGPVVLRSVGAVSGRQRSGPWHRGRFRGHPRVQAAVDLGQVRAGSEHGAHDETARAVDESGRRDLASVSNR